MTLNPVDPALLARACNRLQDRPKGTTADKNIVKRIWLPFDFDPVRPVGVSSTDEEIDRAKAVALQTADWLRSELGDDPAVWGFSGNGWHLLYRIDLPNTEESTSMVKGWLGAVAGRFSDDHVSVDTGNYNAARIWKVYGTLACKGDSVPKIGRIHRRARIMGKEFIDD